MSCLTRTSVCHSHRATKNTAVLCTYKRVKSHINQSCLSRTSISRVLQFATVIIPQKTCVPWVMHIGRWRCCPRAAGRRAEWEESFVRSSCCGCPCHGHRMAANDASIVKDQKHWLARGDDHPWSSLIFLLVFNKQYLGFRNFTTQEGTCRRVGWQHSNMALNPERTKERMCHQHYLRRMSFTPHLSVIVLVFQFSNPQIFCVVISQTLTPSGAWNFGTIIL